MEARRCAMQSNVSQKRVNGRSKGVIAQAEGDRMSRQERHGVPPLTDLFPSAWLPCPVTSASSDSARSRPIRERKDGSSLAGGGIHT